MLSQTVLIISIIATLERALSFHGTHSSSQGAVGGLESNSMSFSNTEASQASLFMHAPLSPPPPVMKSSPLLVQPLVALNSQDRVGIALPELRIQSFGEKCEDCDEVNAFPVREQSTALHEPTVDSANMFFQVGSQEEVEIAQSTSLQPQAPHELQVGEVVADTQESRKDNGTEPVEPSIVGFVAAAQLPPALSEVPPLPFFPDEVPAVAGDHIHVSAQIATQEKSASIVPESNVISTTGMPSADLPVLPAHHAGVTLSGLRKNVSSVDDDQAWTNFTAAEALQNRNRDTEALGIDAMAEPLPSLGKAEVPLTQVQTVAKIKEPLHIAAIYDQSFLARHGVLLLWLLGISSMALVGGLCLACLGAGFVASFIWQRRLDKPTARSQVEELQICSASEVERRLPVCGGYDCTFSKPLSSCQLLRIEARVEGPVAGGTALTAPLTGQTCVLYSVAVSRKLHYDIDPAPVAFASDSIDFVISLKDSPQVRINLLTEDVSLFDMKRGRQVQRRSFSTAPDKWQDFILTHRAGTEWQTSSQLRSDSSSLEFQECALLCGTLATFVGELHRGADGMLSLRPLQLDGPAGDISGAGLVRTRSTGLSERWRTSWECDGSEASNVASQPPSPRENNVDTRFNKVMASDDPALIDGSFSLGNVMSSLLGRISGKGSGRISSLWNAYRASKRTYSQKCPDVGDHTL
jgi:hypothetical protein